MKDQFCSTVYYMILNSNCKAQRVSKYVEYRGRSKYFIPDYSTAVLAAKMCTNSNEHSMYIRFPRAAAKIHFEEQAIVAGTK